MSPEECERALQVSPPKRHAGRARIGTWNVRWFPDGEDGDERKRGGTDLGWLACAIAHLEVDLLAVQEFKRYPAAERAAADLLAALDRLTLGRWQLATERCERVEDGHVGLLWDASRVTLEDLAERPEPLNDKRCDADWRPALVAYARFSGGFDTHVVALHTAAAASKERYQGRKRVFERIGGLASSLQRRRADADLVLLGDLNTSGCDECEPRISSAEEIEQLRATLATGQPALRLIAPTSACSEYNSDKPFLLDHFAVSERLREIEREARSFVDGYCAESRCSSDYDPSKREFYDQLSDHCPVLLDFVDADRD